MAYAHEKAKAEAGKLLGEAVESEFKITPEQLDLAEPRDFGHGNLSCNIAYKLAARLGKKPVEIAEKIVKNISGGITKSKNFSEVKSLNGYINFFFSPAFYSAALGEALEQKGRYGSGISGKGKTVIVEYSSPNVGKPMHIGHIRSTILGDAVARVLRFCGNKVISSNYLCEAGLQTAKLLLSIQMFGKEKIESEKDLLSLYVKIHKQMEAQPELEERARGLVLKMELGDPHLLKELQKIRDLSCKPFYRNYALLGVNFTEEVFDSDYVPEGKRLVEEAIQKGIAFRDEHGEVVAKLEKYGLPNLIILRSNGTTLYSTRDLGLAERDYRKHKFDQRIYVTASEQNLHFQQVFAILEALDKPYAEKLAHIGFGLISLEEGRLSTREGRVLLLEGVLNDAVKLAKGEMMKFQNASEFSKQQVIEKKLSMDAKEVEAVAKMVGVAALKYSVLKISAEKEIKFSLKESVRFDGNTATYLQYTAVRAKNILRKAKEGKIGAKKGKKYKFSGEESKLVSIISLFPQTIEGAARNYQPNVLCDYLFKLALQFSSFYDKSPVLKAETDEARAARLKIVEAALIVIQNGLQLLGIEIPEKM